MGNRVNFIGIPLDNLSMSETLDRIENSISYNKQIHHCVINAGKVVKNGFFLFYAATNVCLSQSMCYRQALC